MKDQSVVPVTKDIAKKYAAPRKQASSPALLPLAVPLIPDSVSAFELYPEPSPRREPRADPDDALLGAVGIRPRR